MKKLYCVIFGKYRKFEKPKITLVLSIISSECKNEDKKIFKEEESFEILKILGLIQNIKLLLKYGRRKQKSRILVEKYR